MQYATIERADHHRLKRFEVLLQLLLKVHHKGIRIVDNFDARGHLCEDRSATEEGLTVELMIRHQRQNMLQHGLLPALMNLAKRNVRSCQTKSPILC